MLVLQRASPFGDDVREKTLRLNWLLYHDNIDLSGFMTLIREHTFSSGFPIGDKKSACKDPCLVRNRTVWQEQGHEYARAGAARVAEPEPDWHSSQGSWHEGGSTNDQQLGCKLR